MTCVLCLGLAAWCQTVRAGTEPPVDTPPPSVLRGEPVHLEDILPPPLDQFPSYAPYPEPLPGLFAQRGMFDDFGGEDKDRVNVTRATLYSFVLPGAGQWYAGRKGRAGAFLATEGIAWAAFGYFKTVSAVKRKDYQAYARANAGIDPEGKGDEFYRLISFYDNRDEYNTAGRIISPSRPYYPDVPYWDWQWRSDAAREEYRSLRNQSNEANNRAKFSLGALLVNRLIAAADAWRTAKSANREARMEATEWKLRMNGTPLGDNPRLKLTLSRSF